MENERCYKKIHALYITASLVIKVKCGEYWKHVGVTLGILREVFGAVYSSVHILFYFCVFFRRLELIVYQTFKGLEDLTLLGVVEWTLQVFESEFDPFLSFWTIHGFRGLVWAEAALTDVFFCRGFRIQVYDRDCFRHLEHFRCSLAHILLLVAWENKRILELILWSTFSLGCFSHVLLKRVTN